MPSFLPPPPLFFWSRQQHKYICSIPIVVTFYFYYYFYFYFYFTFSLLTFGLIVYATTHIRLFFSGRSFSFSYLFFFLLFSFFLSFLFLLHSFSTSTPTPHFTHQQTTKLTPSLPTHSSIPLSPDPLTRSSGVPLPPSLPHINFVHSLVFSFFFSFPLSLLSRDNQFFLFSSLVRMVPMDTHTPMDSTTKHIDATGYIHIHTQQQHT